MVKMNARAGFTLVEILIAITIVGLMAAVFYGPITNYRNQARVSATKQSLRTLQLAIENFSMATGSYPETLKDLVTKPSNPDIAANWDTKFIDKIPQDAWGKPFVYKRTPDGDQEYELYSYGAAGKKGGKKDWIYAKN